MISESENTLSKLVENSVKLLSTLEGEMSKLRKWKILRHIKFISKVLCYIYFL